MRLYDDNKIKNAGHQTFLLHATHVLIVIIFHINVVTFHTIENRAILGPCQVCYFSATCEYGEEHIHTISMTDPPVMLPTLSIKRIYTSEVKLH